MLKRKERELRAEMGKQPPSGGCVLKQTEVKADLKTAKAAAFGRLCVETSSRSASPMRFKAAAFGRLCVETRFAVSVVQSKPSSRLRAAVC